MLARAKNAPLEIDINIIITTPDMDLFPPHLSHTRVLRLRSMTVFDKKDIKEIFSREAPALEHFELKSTEDENPITFKELGSTTLFKGQAPKLRSFCISELCIPWSFIPRGQLTQLKILLSGVPDVGPSSFGNAREFIDLLVNCPALEILVLELCLPSDLSQSSQVRTVHLPHLSRLRVKDSSFGVTNLLKMLRLPSNTTLHLHCFSDYHFTHSDNDYLVLSVVSAHFQTSVPVEFKSLKVILRDTRPLLDIVASTSLLPLINQSSRDIEADMDDEAGFILSFDGFDDENVYWREILQATCKMLPILNLEFLSINTHPISPINWAELFKQYTNVTTIQAIGRGTSAFIRDLTPPNTKKGKRKRRQDSGTSAVPAPGPIIFPSLTLLLLEDLNLNERKSQSGVLYDVLTNSLRQRNSTYNVPMRELRVDHCVISVQQANALKELVAEFHWDEEEKLMNRDFVGSPQDGSESSENYSDGG